MYNNVKEVAKQPTLWASMIGFINPVTACIGVAGLVVYAIIKSASKKEPLATVAKQLNKPSPNGSPTVKATVPALTKSLTSTVQSTVNEPLLPYKEPFKNELLNDEAHKKEMIRQAMSELGKRSGKARARKREEE
jgi:hypothetical protein